MAVKRTYLQTNTTYFVTFTCYNWLPLIERTSMYDVIYSWFDILKAKGNFILGYVIMPNHLHTLIRLNDQSEPINTLIAEGKRFQAYEIVNRLENLNQKELLGQLESGVTEVEKKKGSKHKVFTVSFDCKECYTNKFIQQKLIYMHLNPVKAGLAINEIDYIHSSAKFYMTAEQGKYPITSYLEFYDIPIA